MTEDQVRRTVLAILDSNGLSWSTRTDGYSMRFASALLSLSLLPLGAQTLIILRAPLLRNVPLSGDRAHVLDVLNSLNQETHFAKWVLYEKEGVIMVEYDLLGDHLQENELMTALTVVARLADQQDDVLQELLGGEKAFE